jgi:FAD/FMN-containing dehydrogenase
MMANRRSLIRASLAATTALAVPSSAMAKNADAEESRDWQAADDFGHLVRRHPQAVIRPASTADIAAVLQRAARRGLSVAPRGQGHSLYGRAMADIVVDMTALAAVHEIEGDRLTVEAGATWRQVLAATLARGLTPPVLTNYLDLSVGGTLAVGGIGGTTWRHGLQTDNVLALTVVTGDGRELDCSSDTNPDLFDAARAGLGQCAIITRATMRLMQAPQRVRRLGLFYPDLRSLSADLRLVLDERRFDHLQGAVIPDGAGGWKYQLEGAVFHDGDQAPGARDVLSGLSDRRGAAEISDLTYAKDVGAFARLEDLLRANGQWRNPHPWLLTFLPGSSAEDVAAEVLGRTPPRDIGPFGRITFYPILTEALRTPLARLPQERIVFPFNLVRMPMSDDAAGAQRLVADNRVVYDRIREAGGVLYPVSAFPMSRDDWTEHFGPRWPLLRDARRRYDPRGTLTPGYEVFRPA